MAVFSERLKTKNEFLMQAVILLAKYFEVSTD
jgi:hypothetical protein